MFELGLLDLETKAKVEGIYWQIARNVVKFFEGMRYIPEEVRDLSNVLADQYFCNFSVFQSLLDHWALGQLFPIMPIHRLNESPERNATHRGHHLRFRRQDQQVHRPAGREGHLAPAHVLRPGEPYYLGLFLVGAYQDIMGDLHNLFGRVTEAHVFLDEDEDSGYYIEEIIEGSTMAQVLALTQWQLPELNRLMKAQIDAAIKSDRMKPNEAMRLLAGYEKSLQGYTYLTFNNTK